jgi:HPt (histidine-containing phosphotransfer) domain-containing protein
LIFPNPSINLMAMSLPPIIDAAAISNLRTLGGDDEDFLGEIIGIFLADMPQRISELETGREGTNTEKFMRAAHSIKGSAANLGAMRLQDSADRLEQQARLTHPASLGPHVAEVKAEFEQARLELELLRAEPKSP